MSAGKGRTLAMKAKADSSSMLKTQNILIFVIAIFSMIAPWWARKEYDSVFDISFITDSA